MKAKAFIDSLCEQFAEEFSEVPGVKDLEVPFREAVLNLPVGQLQTELNEKFHKFLKMIQRNLKRLHMTAVPSISGMDDSIEELAKSDLEPRTDIAERDIRNTHKMLCNYMVQEPKKPSLKAMRRLDDKHRKIVYRTFLKNILGRAEISDTLIRTVIQDFDDTCNISELTDHGKSKFDWLPMCNVLLQLTTGSRPLAFIRVLKVLFESVQNDVNKCVSNGKTNRAGKLAEILKKFVISSHMGLQRDNLRASEIKMYCRYMSALLSFYVDLCAVRSSKIEQKKVYGGEIAGFVGYILQPWPESVLEVVLQLQRLEDEHFYVLLPLFRKSLEVKPWGKGHMYYLKYVLLVRQIKDSYGEHEQIQECNLETKVNVPATVGFLDWLREECPEALEHVPSEDKKFKKTKITKFLLEEAEDDLIAILLDGLSKEDDNTHDQLSEKVAKETDDITMATKEIYFLDKARVSTVEQDLCNEDYTVVKEANVVTMPTEEMYFLDKSGTSTAEMAGEKISSKSTLKHTSEKLSTKSPGLKHKPIVLKTVEDMEQLVDTEMEQGIVKSPQTYTLDPLFIKEKVKDPDDRKFLQSGIVSITSVGSIICAEETNDTDELESELKIESEENDTDNRSPNRPVKWMGSTSSTPNKQKEPKRKSNTPQKIEETDVSDTERSTDFCTSLTSISEDECKIKSVVRKVTPRNGKSGSRSPIKMSERTVEAKFESAFVTSNHECSTSSRIAVANKPKAENDSESVISNSESGISITDTEDVMEAKVKDLEIIAPNVRLIINTDESLSSLNESSAEVVNIVIESENSDTSNQNSELPTKVKTKSKLRKSASPKKSSSKTDGSMVETNLGHESDPNTALSESELTFVTTTSLSRASDHNTTLAESDIDKTSKYVGGKRRGSLYRTADESGEEALGGQMSRRSSNKYLRNDTIDDMQTVGENANDIVVQQKYMKKVDIAIASPRKISRVGGRVSGMHGESDGDVFCTPEIKTVGKPVGKNTTSTIEEKFIGKAIKGKKTPKKSVEKNDSSQFISGSVSLFTDGDDDLGTNEAEGESAKRTKSTEEIIGIVEEIKGKIKSPQTIKSMSKGNGKLNESMFTDDSMDMAENETNISVQEIKSPKKDEQKKSSYEVNKNDYLNKIGINSKMNISGDNLKENIAKTAGRESVAIGNKTPSKLDSLVNSENKVDIIDLSHEESDEEKDVVSGEESDAVSCDDSDDVSGKESDAVSGKESDAVSGKESDAVSGEESDAVSGEESDAVSGEESDQEKDVVSGKESDAVSCDDSDDVSGKESDAVSGEESDAVSGEESDAVSGEESDAVSGKESDAISDKDNEIEGVKESGEEISTKDTYKTQIENENSSKTIKGRSLAKVTPHKICADLSIDELGKNSALSPHNSKRSHTPVVSNDIKNIDDRTCDGRSPNKEKTAKSGNLIALNSSFTVQSISHNSMTDLNISANKNKNYIEIVSDNESDEDIHDIKKRMESPIMRITDKMKTPEKIAEEKSKIFAEIKTPRTDMKKSPTSGRKIKGNIDTIKTQKKTEVASPKSVGGKSPRNTDTKIIPKSDRKLKGKVDAIKTPEKTDVTETNTPRSNRGNTETKNSPKSDRKLQTPNMNAEITPTLDTSMRTPSCNANTEKVTTPKSQKKMTPSPMKMRQLVSQTKSPKDVTKHESVFAALKSPIKWSNKTKTPVESEDDFVPSSQKKPRTKSDTSGLCGKNEAAVTPSSSIGSDEDINLIPYIGAHLRPDHSKSPVVASNSLYMPSISESNRSHKKETDCTPRKGSRRSKRMMQSPESGTKDNDSAISRPRSTRNRGDSESAVENESDINGSTRPKRLRSSTKAAHPEAAMSAVKKGGVKKGKTNLHEVYEFQSETDITTDQSDTETRSTRRSVGGRRISANKSKIPDLVTEEPENLLMTPPGKVTRQRKGSASTSKKAVEKLKDLHGTRKRQLSGELYDGLASGSTYSEVSFPKLVKPVAQRKGSRRSSVEPIHQEHGAGSSTSGKRYTLRNK